jgi:hypothetical protein
MGRPNDELQRTRHGNAASLAAELSVMRTLRRTLVLVVLLTAGCFAAAEPRDAELQLISWSKRISEKTTRAEVLRLVAEYPLLRVLEGPGVNRITIQTPPRFGAKDWLALVEFGPTDQVRRVAWGWSDYAPVRPKYAHQVPAQMPPDRCFGTPTECEAPWFQTP